MERFMVYELAIDQDKRGFHIDNSAIV